MPLLGRLMLRSQGIQGPGGSLASLLGQLRAAAEPERPCEVSGKALQQRQLCGRAHDLCCTACAHSSFQTYHLKLVDSVFTSMEVGCPVVQWLSKWDDAVSYWAAATFKQFSDLQRSIEGFTHLQGADVQRLPARRQGSCCLGEACLSPASCLRAAAPGHCAPDQALHPACACSWG